MRKIESDMLAAIKAGKNWKNDNTRVVRIDSIGQSVVYLHGSHLATVDDAGNVEPSRVTFRMYPTVTTRSRLRALGVNADAYIPRKLDKPRQAYIDGVAL